MKKRFQHNKSGKLALLYSSIVSLQKSSIILCNDSTVIWIRRFDAGTPLPISYARDGKESLNDCQLASTDMLPGTAL